MPNVQTFKASAYLQDGVQVRARARDFEILIDEPASLGGTDTGMNPVEALLASLGACQSIVARVYAPKFGIQLEHFSVEVEGEIDLDGFFNRSEARPGYSEIRYTFRIGTPSSEDQVSEFIRFLESKCPVGDTLANPVRLVLAQVNIERSSVV
ncbi:OsmC family protein [Paenibacillus mucilaginosus]|uniref:OsmC family protein n=1 Tax=Paenibacillus mucilaginosus (strain KNP414) TaxID=1036673 RepID=F8F9A6_PAEMK|nr:OsmC family protein [Paenibacillus mucilaginosus]AEI43034.1 OsmC family protein [Paenibacillus mucilaginosus KNP414]MCG7215974.1 OsmC family protein [Paenibacillus mucilaginosus]WDM24659.1 OsmC family protein [Paenibacillus mucilaginosus]